MRVPAENPSLANTSNELVWRGDGNDWLFGDAGNVTVLGGTGDDVLDGGTNEDSLDTGSKQVAGDGVAIFLLADQLTTGGHLKIVTILSLDCAGFAQMRSRDPVRFEAITAAAFISAVTTRRSTHSTNLSKLCPKPRRPNLL